MLDEQVNSSAPKHMCLSISDCFLNFTYRWAQQLGGVDFLGAPGPEGSRATIAAADGNVLAGLSEYRTSGRAIKALQQLHAAQKAIATPKP